jgi:hypothetical protein
VNANDVKTFFEATAAQWDTMRLTYYDEQVIETIADAIAIDDTQTCSTSEPAPDSSPLASPPEPPA